MSSRANLPGQSDLSSTRKAAAERERTACVRALLRVPLITAHHDPDGVFRLVRRHETALRDWFDAEAGWRLWVDNECARLHKGPAHLDDATRGAVDPRTPPSPFTRQRYVLLCLALATLERGGRQTVLGRLAREITRSATGDPALSAAGLDVDPESRDYRRDLAAVARLLLEWGVLRRDHGSEEGFVNQSEDVLYTVRRSVLAQLLSVERGPSLLADPSPGARLAALRAVSEPESEDGRRRRLRHALTRRLLDDPVVYYADLPPGVFDYFQSQRARTANVLESATGMLLEIRKDAAALVDPDNDCTDAKLPDEGTRGHAALLLAEWLSARLRDDPACRVADAEVEAELAALADQHATHWRKSLAEADGIRVLLREVVDGVFIPLGLVRRGDDGRLVPLSALGRYAMAAPVVVRASREENDD